MTTNKVERRTLTERIKEDTLEEAMHKCGPDERVEIMLKYPIPPTKPAKQDLFVALVQAKKTLKATLQRESKRLIDLNKKLDTEVQTRIDQVQKSMTSG